MAGFISARPGCRWLYLGARLWSSGSVEFVWPIRARPVGHWVHSGAPWGFVGFIRARSRCRGVEFIRVCVVDSGAPWVSLGSFGRALCVVRFVVWPIWACP